MLCLSVILRVNKAIWSPCFPQATPWYGVEHSALQDDSNGQTQAAKAGKAADNVLVQVLFMPRASTV